MDKKLISRAKLNILTTLIRQGFATVCGIIIPRLMIATFGSVIYGATTSIAQFLSYISLLESGIGRVARGALYRPLAQKNNIEISKIYWRIKEFFKKIGFVFLIYVIILGWAYYDIANITEFSRMYTFGLVLAISVSTFATYMGGIANMTLMHADQKQYLTNTIITVTNVLNTICIALLIKLKAGVATVKLASSFVFVLRPIMYSAHVKKNYNLSEKIIDKNALPQKWTGIGQHIAYFLHNNTDIVLLTLFADLRYVAVYSIYKLVISSVWNIANSFTGGMEAAFGELIAKEKHNELRKSYGYYKTMLTVIGIVLFGSTGVLIIPFIKLYTAGITDANYIQPVFAVIMLVAEAINCISFPCSSLPISANKLKETRWGSYGEAVINILVSCALIKWNPLVGVAMGTLVATIFKSVYYMGYSAKKILLCKASELYIRYATTVFVIVFVSVFGTYIFSKISISNYFVWCIYGGVTVAVIGMISAVYGAIFYREETGMVINKIKNKFLVKQ